MSGGGYREVVRFFLCVPADQIPFAFPRPRREQRPNSSITVEKEINNDNSQKNGAFDPAFSSVFVAFLFDEF